MEINSTTNSEKKQMNKTPFSNQPVSVIIYSNLNENNQKSNKIDSKLNDQHTDSIINSHSLLVNDNNLKNSSVRMQQLKKYKVKKIVNNYDHSKYLNNNKSSSINENYDNDHDSSFKSVSRQLNSSPSINMSSSEASPDTDKMLNNETESADSSASNKTENNENIKYIQLDLGLNDETQNESSDYQILNNESSSSSYSNTNNSNNTNAINTGALMLNNSNNNTHYQNYNNLDLNMKEKSINNDDRSALNINETNGSISKIQQEINSIRHKSYLYRSTPNLNEINDTNQIINNQILTKSNIKDGLNFNANSINDYNNNTSKLKSYPSNLELSTNLNDNMIISHHQLELEFQRSANFLNRFDAHGLKTNFRQRYKLIVEGDIHICKLPNSRNVISKILNSKILRRWKSHRVLLTDNEIYSANKSDYMDKSIPYHTIVEISPISKWEPGQKCCFRIATLDCHYLFQTNNAFIRDQWIHSILWKKHKFKSERVLRNANRPEILIKEIKNMIDMSLSTPIDDKEIYNHPLEIVSEILQKHNLPKQTHEHIIVGLSPLLEKNHPSPEICDFFSKHCRDSPRSHIVIEMFTPVVQRILKHNGDFGKYPHMRLFVQNYLMALVSQNGGMQTVQNFVVSMHSLSSQCPFPRVLPNFVAVCLAAIHGCFETPFKSLRKQSTTNDMVSDYQLDKEEQMICYTTMMHTMSKFEDWRIHLAQLLQSRPFPDKALTSEKFIKIFKKVVENFAQDTRCEVHLTLLGIREGKEGWFEIFAPGGMSCDDDGELFASMLQRLVGCCCKKKRFLLSINKLLAQIIQLALREVPCAIDTLCAMLDLDGIENLDNKPHIITALQSTELGLEMYAKVLERQIKLRELQKKGGPRKLTLPSRSTDEDLAKLLLSGSFGNLECLSLAFTNVTSACAEYLIKLPSLRYLNLWSTKFGDEGLELISEHLQRLQVLNLCETPVTDKGLACLASMKQLRKLNLNSTNLSELTFEGLKECLPALQECDIRYTDAW